MSTPVVPKAPTGKDPRQQVSPQVLTETTVPGERSAPDAAPPVAEAVSPESGSSSRRLLTLEDAENLFKEHLSTMRQSMQVEFDAQLAEKAADIERKALERVKIHSEDLAEKKIAEKQEVNSRLFQPIERDALQEKVRIVPIDTRYLVQIGGEKFSFVRGTPMMVPRGILGILEEKKLIPEGFSFSV